MPKISFFTTSLFTTFSHYFRLLYFSNKEIFLSQTFHKTPLFSRTPLHTLKNFSHFALPYFYYILTISPQYIKYFPLCKDTFPTFFHLPTHKKKLKKHLDFYHKLWYTKNIKYFSWINQNRGSPTSRLPYLKYAPRPHNLCKHPCIFPSFSYPLFLR